MARRACGCEFCQALKGAATLTFVAWEDGNLRLIGRRYAH